MRVLILGGTGLISVGIIKHLLSRNADITMFNRGKREANVDPKVKQLTGDRNDFDVFERRFANERFDVVIDMIAFRPQHASSSIRAFRGRCEHFIFCSTVCVYGVNAPPTVLIDESFPLEPISSYGRDKKACEEMFMQAHQAGDFNVTNIRPSNTYGEGGTLIDQLEFDPPSWDRIKKGQPVICAGDGLGLWNSTHRDDVGKLFAHAAMNKKTFDQAYNATTDRAAAAGYILAVATGLYTHYAFGFVVAAQALLIAWSLIRG
ncbi:MAG TPA: NAD-dependent epimerase/dehydratase family protein, partial [Tepidisphaeraceae bacterium]|nr:NAD-dependent epimerase/dehydratase family protein [Tepidisphaeraceae bacterium]